MADACLVIGVICSPKRTQLAEQIGAFVGHFGRTEPIDRIGAGLAADARQLVADLVDGLIPIDPRPLAVDKLQRIFQAALAANEFAHRGALGAMRAAINRRIPTRLLADPHPVCDFCRNRAADGTMGADAFADESARRERAGGGRFRLAYGVERNRPESREAASSDSRASQKCAAVERAGVSSEPCERAAARLMV